MSTQNDDIPRPLEAELNMLGVIPRRTPRPEPEVQPPPSFAGVWFAPGEDIPF